MRILSLNVGSSTVKFAVYDMSTGRPSLESSIDHPSSIDQAVAQVRQHLTQCGEDRIEAIGHRIAHGGSEYRSSVLIDPQVEAAIERLTPLAPQHNPASLAGLRATRVQWPDLPQVAVFDTAFHASMPPRASTYAVPKAWRDAGIKRYGFHGLSHQYVMEAVAAGLGERAANLRIVSCHLGNGASVCAIDRGRSVDTSMGMTALEGLVMGSRCGDLDPGAFGFLRRTLGLGIEEIEQALYRESGLKALSELDADMRTIEAKAARGHQGAQLALQVYSYRVQKYIGAYAAAMGGCDVIAFTGGIGENSAGMRWRIACGLEFIGVHLDADRNDNAKVAGFEIVELQQPHSRIKLILARAQEQWIIARETFRLLGMPTRITGDARPRVPVAVSAHHVHLTQEAVEALFGPGYQLTVLHPLSQPGNWAARETVSVVGPRGRIERVRVLGPCRAANQIEISRTEALRIGIDAPLRLSGHTEGTPAVTLIGDNGSLRSEGLIVAQRHIHLAPADAQGLGACYGDRIDVTVNTPRPTVLRDVVLRVSSGAVLEMHIDTDEANAAGIAPGGDAVLVRSHCDASLCGDMTGCAASCG